MSFPRPQHALGNGLRPPHTVRPPHTARGQRPPRRTEVRTFGATGGALAGGFGPGVNAAKAPRLGLGDGRDQGEGVRNDFRMTRMECGDFCSNLPAGRVPDLGTRPKSWRGVSTSRLLLALDVPLGRICRLVLALVA